MIKALDNKNLLTRVAEFLPSFEDIISFKESGRKINIKLNPETNEILNEWFLHDYLLLYKDKDDEDYYEIKLGEIIYDANNEIRKINWQDKIKETNELKEKMEYLLDKNINNILDYIYKNQIYLPDLRKSNYYLEFSNSSIFMLKLYDINKLQRMEKFYYDKYITEEYMFSPNEIKKIVPLRENLFYEKELLNIRESFREIKENERYINILNEQIMEYNYKLIENEFKDFSKDELNAINPIFCFIYLMTEIFKHYLLNVNASILRFKNYPKKEKYLIEFIKQHNNVMNVILFKNSKFNNANIIINNWNKFLNKDNKEKSEKKFSLLILFLNMYKDKVFNSIINDIINVLKEYLLKKPKKEEKIILKENKMIIDDDINMESTDDNDNSFCSLDEKNEIKNEEAEIKKIIQGIGNCILDIEMNEENACGINHTKIKLGEIYKNYENALIEVAEINLIKSLEESDDPIKTFEEIKNLLEADKSHRLLRSKNIKLINRTKKKLVESITNIFINYVKEKFDINNKYYSRGFQTENFDEFSEKSEKKIKESVEKEINIIKGIIIKKYKEKEKHPPDLEKIVNDYIDRNGDNNVILTKKIIYFYYKEMQFYKDNDKIVRKMLEGSSFDPCLFFTDKNI